ncbi:phosphate ABC transporter permease PstA [Georgenia sp. 311]|uniref:Phosphate transport system permease protein PstA n=1 Tax=Georgenia wutianyii TaxID=2585135 RepID=A0ABX5VQ70_9MICO|nr:MULTISPECIES: phosphate ABC transporter permease PstA [Georgenia]QDB80385.1 phosphate ABC transporter permease PstA [Georgenia wutianyii]TNC16917.1 phosphate ABC transporter permease PstA [Georgenia sp. 311]
MTTTALHQVRRLPSWAPWAVLAGSVAVALAVLALGGGPTVAGVGFLTALVYAPLLTAISWQVEGSRRAKDRLATTLVVAAFVVAMVPLVTLVWTVVAGGVRAFSWEFLTTDMVGVFGQMTEGGAYHAIIGTLYVTGIASLIAIPLGIFTAIYLVEYGGGRAKRAITLLVDVMTGIPSIVAGLFAFTLFLVLFGPGYKSALIGGIALAVLMTPVVVRSVEEMLRLVPNELREAAYALGVPKWLTIVKVVLRTAIAGITTGVMIAIARVIGETAPLLITVGIANAVNYDAFDGRIATLPVYVYRQYAQGGVSEYRAWAGALTLIIIVMLLNLVARLVSRYFSPKVR